MRLVIFPKVSGRGREAPSPWNGNPIRKELAARPPPRPGRPVPPLDEGGNSLSATASGGSAGPHSARPRAGPCSRTARHRRRLEGLSGRATRRGSLSRGRRPAGTRPCRLSAGSAGTRNLRDQLPPTLPPAAAQDGAPAAPGHPPKEAVPAFPSSERDVPEGLFHARIVLRDQGLVKRALPVLCSLVCIFPTTRATAIISSG